VLKRKEKKVVYCYLELCLISLGCSQNDSCTDRQLCAAAKRDRLLKCLDVCSDEFLTVPPCVTNSQCRQSRTEKHQRECRCDNGFTKTFFKTGSQACLGNCTQDTDCSDDEVCYSVNTNGTNIKYVLRRY
jgi:hypothetical protein